MKFQINTESKADRQMLDDYLDETPGVFWVDVDKIRKSKSRPNENYYWKSIVRPLLKWKGYVGKEAEEDLHDWLLTNFSYKWVDDIEGNPYCRVIRSTDKDFDSTWQAQYHEKIRIYFGTEHQFILAEPNEDLDAPIDPKFKG